MSDCTTALISSGRSADRNRLGAVLVGSGISILLVRAALLIAQSRQVLRRWVIDLAALELAADVATVGASIRWGLSKLDSHRRLPLRLAAFATILHAVRVLVFVLGRLRPFKDFDVRPEQREDHDDRWSWGQVCFASVMSVLGLIGVVIVRRRLRRH